MKKLLTAATMLFYCGYYYGGCYGYWGYPMYGGWCGWW